MRDLVFRVLCAPLLLAWPAVASAEASSELLFSYKAWEVHVVGFDDGSISCLAQVTDGARSFSMWADAEQMVELQFYDESWDMGEGQTANLEVQIDRRSPWSLSNAELHLQSVFFNLPDSDEGVNFMTEVMNGNVLYLRTEDGSDVENYSLSGSSRSVAALIDCVSALQSDSDSNPFN